MKKTFTISAIFLIMMAVESSGQKQSGKNDLIAVDVRKNISQKKELILQDFMDVEYIVLETKEDFLNQGIVEDIGKEIIIIKNQNRIRDGNIFIYDRSGKALRKINRQGQGPEEYTVTYNITLDEENEEIFVNDLFKRKIVVYDLFGKYKRSIKQKDGIGSYYTNMFNFDKNNLICYNSDSKEKSFVLISKQDGSITKEIQIPFKEHKFLQKISGEDIMRPGPYRPIIPYYDGNWILLEISSDTVYTLLPDYSLRPFIVRNPSVQSMDPEVILRLRLLSDRYYFMETVKNEFNFDSRSGFPYNYFMYDKQEKSFYGYTIYNGDFINKKEIQMTTLLPINHEIESWFYLQPFQLIESYKKGEIKDGKLKEIAEKLNEEDNPVIMLVKHKK